MGGRVEKGERFSSGPAGGWPETAGENPPRAPDTAPDRGCAHEWRELTRIFRAAHFYRNAENTAAKKRQGGNQKDGEF
jgi:hypothetical protein